MEIRRTMGKKACQKNSGSLSLSGSKYSKSESPQIEDEQANEASDKIKDQQDLFNKSECAFKEEVTRLKAQLKEGNNVRKQQKEKEDQCQKLQDELTSLRNEVNKKSTTIKKLKDRSSYYESLEAKILSLKEDLENSNKQNK